MPPGPNPLQAAGAKPSRDTQGTTLYHNRFFTGLVTQRNILRDPAGVVQERWYGGRSDALLDGVNVELTNRLTLARAPGSTAYSSATLPQAANSFYSFKKFTTGTETITVMADTPAVLYSINPTSKTTVLTKAAGAGPAYLIGVGNTLYIGDGVEQMAWNGIAPLRNWGIGRYQNAAGANAYAGTGTDNGGGHNAWVNPGNITAAPNTVYATTATVIPAHAADYISNYLDATNYGGFGVGATDTITGVQLIVTGFQTGFSGTLIAALLYAGAVVGVLKSAVLPGSAGTVTLGGSSDLWGGALTAAMVTSSSFGVRLYMAGTNGGGSPQTNNASLDAANLGVYRTGSPPVALVAGGVSPAPATGYQYVAAYGNNGSPVGQASPPSPVIKPDATHSVQVSLTASADAQVNQIYVFRTRDGGSVYENLPGSPYPNTSGNITDSAADATLNVFQLADLNGLNTPPPAGFVACESHMGRIWGAVGNVVYYSVGPDLGFILGNGNEGFPPANFFTFPSQVVRLLSLNSAAGSVLLVFTISDVYPIYGNVSAAGALAGLGGTVFYAGATLLKKVGLASYNALDARGSIIYMMTNDGRVISFNPSSQIVFLDPEKALNEIGFPIGAQPPSWQITLTGGSLAGFTSSSAYVTWHGAGSADQALYVADGSTGWFRCNANQQPDGGSVWSTKRNIVGGCSAVQSIETSPGLFQLLIGPPAGGGSVLYRDTTVFADATVAYPSNCRIGAITLAQPGQLANPTFLTADFAYLGSNPTLSVLFDELDAANGAVFTTLVKTDNDPPHLTAPLTVFSYRYHVRQATSGAQIPAACRWMQLKVDFGSSDGQQNELLTLSIFGSYEQEA